jgi:signal transduction histidine kinase
MTLLARGAAFLDPSGAVLAADAGFLAALALAADDPGGELRRRAAADPALRGLLEGVGPPRLLVEGPAGACWIERAPGPGGVLLLARGVHDLERMEHVACAQGFPRLASGLAHDIKNSLNAMALQVAILTEKLGEGGTGEASAGHLAALRSQIAKVDEVVRRFCDVAEPSAPYGWVDLGAVVGDVVALHAHEARRRRLRVQLDAPPGVARVDASPQRVVRLLLGLVGCALAGTPDGGALRGQVAAEGPDAVVTLVHAAGDPDPGLGYDSEVAAAAAAELGGSLQAIRAGQEDQVTLRLPRNEHA